MRGEPDESSPRTVAAPEVRQQLHLGFVTDRRIGAFDGDAGLVELGQQPLDRHFQNFGKLCNRHIGHGLTLERSALVGRFEPVGPRGHDQFGGTFGVDLAGFSQLIH